MKNGDKIKIQYEDIPIILTPLFKCPGKCQSCINPVCLII